MTYSWNNPSSTFTTPSFGIDSAGAFSGVGNTLASNPLSSAGGGGMAFPVGAVIGAAGSAIGGIAGGKGAKSAADQAREAYEMQLPFKVAGAVGNVFKNINEAVAPARAYELAIRAQTPGLIAQTYANNPFANRKWIS